LFLQVLLRATVLAGAEAVLGRIDLDGEGQSHSFDEESNGLVATQVIVRPARPMDQDHGTVWSQGHVTLVAMPPTSSPLK
jgi:hypothetical protein